MNTELMFSTGNNETGTPLGLYVGLHHTHHFVADMAASQALTLHPEWYGPDHPDPARRDCLSIDWPTTGPVFLNPPYGEPERACKADCTKKRCVKRGWHTSKDLPGCIDFVRKAHEQAFVCGVETVALLAARTDTRWFHDYIYQSPLTSFDFLRGRLKFRRRDLVGVALPDEPAPFPSMIVRFKRGAS